MSQKKTKQAKKLIPKVIEMPLRSVYKLKKDFMYQCGNATLQFSLDLGDKKETKKFIEILEKAIVDVKAVVELDTKLFLTE